GPDKSTGRAKYSFDINRPGMLQAMILRSPYAHAKIEEIDTAAAEKMPGVKAIHYATADGKPPVGKELYYAGDELVAMAADTEEHCLDALRAIKVKYTVLEHLVTEQDALKNLTKKTVGGMGTSNVGAPGEATKGNVEEGFKAADAVVEGEYGVPTICH